MKLRGVGVKVRSLWSKEVLTDTENDGAKCLLAKYARLIRHLIYQQRLNLRQFAIPCSTALTEVKFPSVENPKLTNVLTLKSGVDQNIATHATPIARTFFHVKISTFPVLFPDPFNCVSFGLTE